MEIIESQINTTSSEFKANAAHHRALAQELVERLAQVRRGGPERAHRRHREQGKLYVRDRIDRLLDPGSPFLELSPLAAWEMYEGEAPGAGMVSGIGSVAGRSKNTSAPKRLPRRTICPVSTWSTRGGLSCLCRTRSSPMQTISAASSTTRLV
jgi:hypothetical protein